MKRILSIFIALAMVAVTPLTAFAKDWYLEDGDIKITANEDGQFVTQGDVTEKDDNITITQRYEDETENTISVETEDDVTAKFTLKDVNILADDYVDDKSAIDIGDSDAEITVKGENNIEHESNYKATIHVGDGSLPLKGDGTLDIDSYTYGAKIGSDAEEEMSGTIHITDNVKITAPNDYGYGDGAAIGSGECGDFTGKIIIDGNADVTAKSDYYGAGIGSGEYGDFRGEVTIGGNSKVYAEGHYAPGIGAGDDGSFSGGSITIEDNAKVIAIGDYESPAIGIEDGSLDGDIIIKDSAKVYVKGGHYVYEDEDYDYAPEIGSDGNGEDTGSIYIIGNSKVFLYDSDDQYLDIGSTYYNYFGGNIYIGKYVKIEGLKGSSILENLEYDEYYSYYENVYLNAYWENILLYEGSLEENIIGFIKENIKFETPSVPTIGENAIDEVEESNPNTGAPVILMDSHSVVFIPVAVTAKKRED